MKRKNKNDKVWLRAIEKNKTITDANFEYQTGIEMLRAG